MLDKTGVKNLNILFN